MLKTSLFCAKIRKMYLIILWIDYYLIIVILCLVFVSKQDFCIII